MLKTDMKKSEADLQSNQQAEFCIVFVYCVQVRDRCEEAEGRFTEQSQHRAGVEDTDQWPVGQRKVHTL